jgi:hypothetical protein
MIRPYYQEVDFTNWLAANGDKQPKQSAGYIPSLVDNVLASYGLDSIFNSMGNAIKKKDITLGKLEELYAWVNKAATLMKNNPNVLNKAKASNSSISQYCVILNRYIDFLKVNEPALNVNKQWGAKTWNNAFSYFKNGIVKAVAVNGYQSLITSPAMGGNINNFVKLAVESSYFFNTTLVNNCHQDIISKLNDSQLLYARKSTSGSIQTRIDGQTVFIGNGVSIPIVLDPDNNKAVRDLIDSETGYTVSSGTDSFFTDFKISHIWGNAFDPRFFTSLWNIVLVPSWANDLLDKNSSNQKLAQLMINTYKAICEELYDTPSKWKKLGVSGIAIPSNRASILHGTYDINIIGGKNGKPIGTITKKSITI